MPPKKILVIDGKELIVDTSRKVLGNIGHEVFCAHSGEHAIEMAMVSKFDLVIVDAMLPGTNGVNTGT
ncbi:MAG TPA: response regulator [Desulfocapsa sulfexigens]|nr:response regulator [Desulfocapsa sulfexigens]HIQ37933.1 response regulator [Desulfocapsa sulfexigens]